MYWLPLKYWHVLLGGGGEMRDAISDMAHNIHLLGATIANSSDGFRLDWTATASGTQMYACNKGMQFTTHDRDQDTWSTNCASDNVGHNGGFWYCACGQSSTVHADGNQYAWSANTAASLTYRKVYLREGNGYAPPPD